MRHGLARALGSACATASRISAREPSADATGQGMGANAPRGAARAIVPTAAGRGAPSARGGAAPGASQGASSCASRCPITSISTACWKNGCRPSHPRQASLTGAIAGPAAWLACEPPPVLVGDTCGRSGALRPPGAQRAYKRSLGATVMLLSPPLPREARSGRTNGALGRHMRPQRRPAAAS